MEIGGGEGTFVSRIRQPIPPLKRKRGGLAAQKYDHGTKLHPPPLYQTGGKTTVISKVRRATPFVFVFCSSH